MNGRIDEDEHPNRRAHKADTGPHTQHGTSMMVGLQSGATLALGDDDHRVYNLIEFAHVKDEAPKGQAFVPQPTNIGRVGIPIVAQANRGVFDFPDVDGRVEGGCVAKSSRAVKLAQRVCHTSCSVRVASNATFRPGVDNGA